MRLFIFAAGILLTTVQVSEAANQIQYSCTDASSVLTLTIQRTGSGALEYYTESRRDYAYGVGSAECGVNRINRRTGQVLLSCSVDPTGINLSSFAYWLQLSSEAPTNARMTIRAGKSIRDLDTWSCQRI